MTTSADPHGRSCRHERKAQEAREAREAEARVRVEEAMRMRAREGHGTLPWMVHRLRADLEEEEGAVRVAGGKGATPGRRAHQKKKTKGMTSSERVGSKGCKRATGPGRVVRERLVENPSLILTREPRSQSRRGTLLMFAMKQALVDQTSFWQSGNTRTLPIGEFHIMELRQFRRHSSERFSTGRSLLSHSMALTLNIEDYLQSSVTSHSKESRRESGAVNENITLKVFFPLTAPSVPRCRFSRGIFR